MKCSGVDMTASDCKNKSLSILVIIQIPGWIPGLSNVLNICPTFKTRISLEISYKAKKESKKRSDVLGEGLSSPVALFP